ncbi:MAG: DUF2993 domain-containing protein [Microbacterium sp.]
MADAHPTVPLPDPGARWALPADAAASAPLPPRRKRRWPWLVAVLAAAVLVVGAWFAAEHVARGVVERAIREQLIAELDLPADQQIDIDIPGQILPQLFRGRLDRLTISSADVALDEIAGDVVASASDVPIRGDGEVMDASASITLDEAQVQGLLETVDDFPVSTVVFDEPDLDVTMDLQVWALTVPVGVALAPSAAAGELVLTPTAFTIGDTEVSADAVTEQFGAVAATVVRDWEVCIAEHLPAGLTLEDVRVDGDRIVADFAVDGSILIDTSLQSTGACD